MAQTIRPNHGDVAYVAGVYTDPQGRDLTGASFVIGLGTFDEPPDPGLTPDLVETLSTSQRRVSLLVGGTYKPAAGSYWVWVKGTDAPTTDWIRSNRERVIIDLDGNALVIVDNGDGTLTITGPSVVDNGDGTLTISGVTVTDNADGTLYIH